MHDVPEVLVAEMQARAASQQRLARERLGVDPIVVPGGHLSALSHPHELADAIAGLLPPA